jgi:hypothetical protein
MINSPILATTGVAEVAPVVLTDGLVAHYLLNNNADDSVGAIDGVPTIGLGLDFKGDSVYFGGSDSIEIVGVTSTNFTISGWVYNNNGNSVRFYSDSNIEIFLQDGFNLAAKIWTNQDSTGPYNTVVKTWNFPEGWFHVVVTSAGTFYVNGINQNATITPNTISNDYSGDRIGGLVVNGSDLYTAATWISNVRKYNIVADQNLVTALYEEGYYPKPLPLPTTDGLVTHYPLTGTAEDSQGEGGNESGTEFNGVSFVDESVFKGNKVAIFDGATTAVGVSGLTLSTQFSYSFSILAYTGTDEYVIDFATGRGIFSTTTTNVVSGTAGLYDGSAWHDVDYDFDDERWHNVVVLWLGTSIKVYIDNVLHKTFSSTHVATLTGNLAIGSHNARTSAHFTGRLSNVRFYDIALSEADINDLHLESSDSSVIPTSTGLVAHYKFNGDVTDETGSYDGIAYGSLVYSGEQRGDSVASFDGTFEYITALNGATTTGITTLALWGKNDTENANVSYLVGQNGTTHGRTRGIIYSDGKVSFFSRDGALAYKAIDYTMSNLEQTNYHHYALTQQGSIIKAYVDGVLVGTLDMLSSSTFTSTLVFGVIPDDFDFYSLDGKLSSAYSYNRALSDIEIEALYNEIDEPTDGLIAHYPFTQEWRAADRWVAYDGTENGSLTYVDDAEFGSVADFDGLSGYIQAPASISAQTELTISAWVKMKSLTTSFPVYGERNGISGGVADNDILFYLHSSGTIRCFLYGLTTDLIESSVVISVGEWNHVAVRYSGTKGKAHILFNGVQITELSTSGTLSNTINNMRIGEDWFGNTGNANMSDLRVYKRYLIDEEVTDIYNHEKNFRSIDIDDGLVAYYPLAQNSLDNYKNQHDGVDANMTYDGLSGVFNGTTSRINNDADFGMAVATDFAVACWINANDITSRRTILVDGGATNGVEILVSGGNLLAGYSANGVQYGHVLAGISVNTWIHVAYVFGANGTYLYIDGVLADTVATTQQCLEGTDFSTIGALYNGSPYYLDTPVATGYSKFFSGKIAKPRYYNKAITSEQVTVIYNTEKGDFE